MYHYVCIVLRSGNYRPSQEMITFHFSFCIISSSYTQLNLFVGISISFSKLCHTKILYFHVVGLGCDVHVMYIVTAFALLWPCSLAHCCNIENTAVCLCEYLCLYWPGHAEFLAAYNTVWLLHLMLTII